MEKSYKILLPALGKSSRFKTSGIFCDKMFLPINKNWAELVIDSVIKPFCNERFEVIIGVNSYLHNQMCEWLGQRSYDNVEIMNIERKSYGQAHTVMMMLDNLCMDTKEGFSIHNVDTALNYELDSSYTDFSNRIDVFESEGNQWSFIEPIPETMNVKRVTEKVRISNLCSNGFYQFESFELYKNIFGQLYNKNTPNELFIAPMYNTLIENKCALEYRLVSKSEHEFYGTPEEYFKTIGEKDVK